MGAVAVAQHLHAMATEFDYNDLPRAIKRYAPGTIELSIPCSSASNGAQVRPVDIAQHVNQMIFTIGHHQVALAVKRNAATRTTKRPITSTLAADGAKEACTRKCNSPQPPRQFVALRHNAGSLLQRVRDGACAPETHINLTVSVTDRRLQASKLCRCLASKWEPNVCPCAAVA